MSIPRPDSEEAYTKSRLALMALEDLEEVVSDHIHSSFVNLLGPAIDSVQIIKDNLESQYKKEKQDLINNFPWEDMDIEDLHELEQKERKKRREMEGRSRPSVNGNIKFGAGYQWYYRNAFSYEGDLPPGWCTDVSDGEEGAHIKILKDGKVFISDGNNEREIGDIKETDDPKSLSIRSDFDKIAERALDMLDDYKPYQDREWKLQKLLDKDEFDLENVYTETKDLAVGKIWLQKDD